MGRVHSLFSTSNLTQVQFVDAFIILRVQSCYRCQLRLLGVIFCKTIGVGEDATWRLSWADLSVEVDVVFALRMRHQEVKRVGAA